MNKTVLIQLYKEYFNENPNEVVELQQSGSARKYVRISTDQHSVLGVFNPVKEENEAYFSFTQSFLQAGINVPKVLKTDTSRLYYLVEDLGDELLYNHVILCKGKLTNQLIDYYKMALQSLVKMQTSVSDNIDYSKCFPINTFNDDAIQWDLNYFKYNYLKLANVDFNEHELENDFKALKAFLMKFPCDYFMFRDFQSRNILIQNKQLWFIDFQGGRKGPLVYDVVSLLYQAKAQLSKQLRFNLFNYYTQELNQYIKVDHNELKDSFLAFAFLRTLQVLGAYGYRGYFERKSHFIESIPFALNNFKELIFDNDFPLELPYLKKLVAEFETTKKSTFVPHDKLTVSITSFSYKKGIPADPSENGGGFVFDCRSIHNPGRYNEYKKLTGKDQPVIDFFEKEDEMDNFLEMVFGLVDRSIDVYINRGFKHLMVSFGCTGGQHRSVYSAERLAKHLINKYDIIVKLWHREQDK